MSPPRDEHPVHDAASERARETVRGTVYGTHFEGRLPAAFAHHLLPADAAGGGLARAVRVSYRRIEHVEETAPLWESEPGGADTPGRFTLERLDGGFRLLAWGAERGVFDARPGRIDVRWAGGGAGAAHAFFAYTVPLWLESMGVPVLHGSAVVVDGRAVGLIAPSGTGKSVLCAELVRHGAGFLTDDGLALEREGRESSGGESGADGPWWCLPGPPLLRIWPSGLSGRLALAPEDLPRVYAGGDKRWLPASAVTRKPAPPAGKPLAAVYLLDRRNGDTTAGTTAGLELARCSPREALVQFLEHGVAAAPSAVLGLAPVRMARLAEVAESIPVRRLTFPSGGDSAPAILTRIRRHLASPTTD